MGAARRGKVSEARHAPGRRLSGAGHQIQPRPAARAGGQFDGGQWTSGSSGRPRVRIYRTNPDSDAVGDGGFGDGGFGIDIGNVIGNVLGDIASEIDKLNLFGIKPSKPRSGVVRLAGDLPRGLGTPENKPPEVPSKKPGRS